jgi:hypothetical protein
MELFDVEKIFFDCEEILNFSFDGKEKFPLQLGQK